ncbi:hypothetical protein GCM10007298_35810 [Williamsia phyllosphaerae]|uniref:Uncharacterized protein n=1 Tax=Williamsia phyllosphaerae TaxID=885042 RepID=A0ABQ1V4Z9_9NOCA|nr:hypothetical protein GCM10007298_35810 [Williamsia phyllosphaerae]
MLDDLRGCHAGDSPSDQTALELIDRRGVDGLSGSVGHVLDSPCDGIEMLRGQAPIAAVPRQAGQNLRRTSQANQTRGHGWCDAVDTQQLSQRHADPFRHTDTLGLCRQSREHIVGDGT